MKIRIDLSVPRPKFVKPQLLLHPPIPRPLHGLNPRSILGTTWWNKHRKHAFKANDDCCWACGVHKSAAYRYLRLEGHEVYEIDYKKGRAEFKVVVGLCYSCHAFIHRARLKMLLDADLLPFLEYQHIVDRGISLLDTAGLLKSYKAVEKSTTRDGFGNAKDSIVPWSQWRLVIKGKEYPPRFQSYEAWLDYYRKAGGKNVR